jgi:hypothetical protein
VTAKWKVVLKGRNEMDMQNQEALQDFIDAYFVRAQTSGGADGQAKAVLLYHQAMFAALKNWQLCDVCSETCDQVGMVALADELDQARARYAAQPGTFTYDAMQDFIRETALKMSDLMGDRCEDCHETLQVGIRQQFYTLASRG